MEGACAEPAYEKETSAVGKCPIKEHDYELFLATLNNEERNWFESGGTIHTAMGPKVKKQLEADMYEATGGPVGAFETKDSGKRESLANGMVRDTTEGKIDWTLVFDGPLVKRYMQLLVRGAVKYSKRNWMKALTAPFGIERDKTAARFAESAMRHMMQWYEGDRSEDHAAGVLFNLNGYEAMMESGLTDYVAPQTMVKRSCE